MPYYSNPNVLVDGIATGTETENNARYMSEQRFKSAAAGTNCLDGNPDEAWMNFQPTGIIGNNCLNGESSYEPPLSLSRGKYLFLHLLYVKIKRWKYERNRLLLFSNYICLHVNIPFKEFFHLIL